MPTNPWIVCAQPNPAARVRLICFPYAGGGASVFHGWAADLPATLEVCAVQLPGRQNRILEEPYRALPPLLDALAAALAPSFDRPVAFFGHSLGAILAFELARALRRRGQPGPAHLFVSAHRAPQLPSPRPPTYHLPDAEFLAQIRQLGGTPPALLEHAELLELMLPVLRADFELAESYTYTPAPPLACPISAFSGREDHLVSAADLAAWHTQTLGPFIPRLLPGDHFFLQSARPALLAALAGDLAPLLRAA